MIAQYLRKTLIAHLIFFILVYVFLYLFWGFTAYQLGYFPTYGHPDPKNVYSDAVLSSIMIGVIWIFWTSLVLSLANWVQLLCYQLFLKKSIRGFYLINFLYLIFPGLLLLISFYDPIVNWIAD